MWTNDYTKPSEDDGSGNLNNTIAPSDITVLALSSVAGNATTAAMAGQVPKEEAKSALPGSFIETPAAADKSESEAFSVNPLPATAGLGNPIKLAPGEKIPEPSALTPHTIGSTVTTDKESYEKGSNNFLPVTAAGSDAFAVPPVSKSLIPESSLPMGGAASDTKDLGPFTTGIAPTATTVGLAGQVPLEPKPVPGLVTESQKEAHVDPEASSNPVAVEEKKEVEDELKSKVPEAPATAESGLTPGNVAAAVTGAAAAAGAAITGAALLAKNQVSSVAANASTIASGSVSAAQEKTIAPATDTAAGVPDVVTQSLKTAHASPEAASNPTAVEEKSEVEAELAKKIHKSEATGEHAPTASAATTDTAPAATSATPATGATTEAPSTPHKDVTHPATATPDTAASSAKKSKRKSVLLKIKKLFHHDDKPTAT